MNKFLMAIAALALSFAVAHAHKVTWIFVSNNSHDPAPCIYFEVDGVNTWYAIPTSHGSFDYEKAMLLMAKSTGDNTFDFYTGAAVANCSNAAEAYDIQLHD